MGNWKREPLVTVRKVLWELMCDEEGVEPDTSIVVFSEDNLYSAPFDKIVARIEAEESEEEKGIKRELTICPCCDKELNTVYYNDDGRLVWHEEEKKWETVGCINEHECPACGYEFDYDEIVALGII